jgi:hypothetical protein
MPNPLLDEKVIAGILLILFSRIDEFSGLSRHN